MAFFAAHPMFALVAGYYLLNALTIGMPTPGPNSGIAYRWAHGSLNALAFNLDELARARYSQLVPARLTPPSAPERSTT